MLRCFAGIVEVVHPIERLRFVARAQGAPDELLVRETGAALQAFVDDPSALVTACRRIVARQPTSGVLTWFCSRVLTSPDPAREIWEAVGQLEADPTAAELADALPQDATVLVLGWPDEAAEGIVRRGDLRVRVVDLGLDDDAAGLAARCESAGLDVVEIPFRGLGAALDGVDVVLLEPSAAAPGAMLFEIGSSAAVALAAAAGVEVWAVLGVGRVLSAASWAPFVARAVPPVAWAGSNEVVAPGSFTHAVRPRGRVAVHEALAVPDGPTAPELHRAGIV